MKEFNTPKRIEAEDAILATLMVFPDEGLRILEVLEAKDFYQMNAQAVWKAMKSLYSRGVELDSISIHNEIKAQSTTSSEAVIYLTGLYDNLGAVSNLDDYVSQVKNASLLRQVIGLFSKYHGESQTEKARAKSIIGSLEHDLVEISEQIRERGGVTSREIVKEVEEDIEKAEKHGWKGYSTGFPKLDERTGGIFPTHIWIVGAYTGTGKTFFMIQLMLNLLEQEAKVMFFSTEMDKKLMMIRMLANLAELGPLKILKGEVTSDEDKEKLSAAKEKMRGWDKQLLLFDKVYTVDEIRLKVKKQVLKGGVDIVFLDYIQNLKGGTSYDELSKITNDLQHMVGELGPTLIIASQVTQEAANWKRGQAIKYKGSGGIPEISDVGLWIRNDDNKNVAAKEMQAKERDLGGYVNYVTHKILMIRKARHGLEGNFEIMSTFPSGRITQTGTKPQTPQAQGETGELSADEIGT